jgi:hypothetical protein
LPVMYSFAQAAEAASTTHHSSPSPIRLWRGTILMEQSPNGHATTLF